MVLVRGAVGAVEPQDRPVNGVSEPSTSNRLSAAGLAPASSLTSPAPNQYSRTSFRLSPEPPSGRQRGVIAGSGTARCCGRVIQLVAMPLRVLVTRVLAGVKHPATLVEVVADLQHSSMASREALPPAPAGLAGDDIVAGVPDHGVVVAEDAERVGAVRPLRVDVVHVVADAVGVQRVLVVVQRSWRRSACAGDAPV